MHQRDYRYPRRKEEKIFRSINFNIAAQIVVDKSTL